MIEFLILFVIFGSFFFINKSKRYFGDDKNDYWKNPFNP